MSVTIIENPCTKLFEFDDDEALYLEYEDEEVHIYCEECWPRGSHSVKAACGSVLDGLEDVEDDEPVTCVVCADMENQPCPICGVPLD